MQLLESRFAINNNRFQGQIFALSRIRREQKFQTRHVCIADKLNYEVNYGHENNVICSESVKNMLACDREQ